MDEDMTGSLAAWISLARRAVALPHGEAKQLMDEFRVKVEVQETLAEADEKLILRDGRPRKKYAA